LPVIDGNSNKVLRGARVGSVFVNYFQIVQLKLLAILNDEQTTWRRGGFAIELSEMLSIRTVFTRETRPRHRGRCLTIGPVSVPIQRQNVNSPLPEAGASRYKTAGTVPGALPRAHRRRNANS
jgi:hypothetical protein